MRAGLFAFCALVLAGCQSPSLQLETANEVAAAITVENNPHTGRIAIKGPVQAFAPVYDWTDFYAAGRFIEHGYYTLEISISSSDWAFFDSIYAFGELLPSDWDREVGGCSRGGCIVHERAVISIGRQMSRNLSISGLTFQARGRRGVQTFSIPPSYFQGIEAHFPLSRQSIEALDQSSASMADGAPAAL